MGKLLYKRLPKRHPKLVFEFWRVLNLPAEDEKAYYDALKDDENEVLLVVGNRRALKELESNLELAREGGDVLAQASKAPFQPPIVRGELTKELGTFRREELYD